MKWSQRLKYLRARAEEARTVVASNHDQIQDAVQRAGSTASEQTGGKYDKHINRLQRIAAKTVTRVAADKSGGNGPGSTPDA